MANARREIRDEPRSALHLHGCDAGPVEANVDSLHAQACHAISTHAEGPHSQTRLRRSVDNRGFAQKSVPAQANAVIVNYVEDFLAARLDIDAALHGYTVFHLAYFNST